jgi:hypothetical protein
MKTTKTDDERIGLNLSIKKKTKIITQRLKSRTQSVQDRGTMKFLLW